MSNRCTLWRMLARPHQAPRRQIVAIASPTVPPSLDSLADIVWCSSTAELVVLLRTTNVSAAVIEGELVRADPDQDLLHRLASRCPVVVADGPGRRSAWTERGAAEVIDAPLRTLDVQCAIEAIIASGSAPHVAPTTGSIGNPSAEPGALLAVTGGMGADVPAASAALAIALTPGNVVLADFHRRSLLVDLHGLAAGSPGLPDLLGASHHHPPSAKTLDSVLHPMSGGYRLLPGLRSHRDWIGVGPRSLATATRSLLRHVDLLVASLDADLDGEHDTGSFDLEDRNRLTRATVGLADLVVIVVGDGPTGAYAASHQIRALDAFGVSLDRMLVVVHRPARLRPRRPWFDEALRAHTRGHEPPQIERWRRPRRLPIRRTRSVVEISPDLPLAGYALVDAIRSRLDSARPRRCEREEWAPQLVAPGSIGHWAHDVDGWMTPRVPQQP